MNNKGITIITLIVMIAVIIILTSIFMATGLDSLNETKNTEVQHEISQLKQAVINRYTSYEKNDGNILLIGSMAKSEWSDSNTCVDKIIPTLVFEDETDDEKLAKVNKITDEITRDYDKFVMIVTADDAEKLGLENFSDNRYVVNYYTGSVYGPIEE